MRLLRTNDQSLELVTYHDEAEIPPYAILSHTWFAAEEEVSLSDLGDYRKASRKKGWAKLSYARQQARKDRFDFVWIDTCCIDKTSSAELAEAINSMYRWYERARICYVYLDDMINPRRSETSNGEARPVSIRADPKTNGEYTGLANELPTFSWDIESFRRCKWFRRGWTLQEMLAPPTLAFFNVSWDLLGRLGATDTHIQSSSSHPSIVLSELIQDITGVHAPVLLRDHDVDRYSIAQRMCWAADRVTTRSEDRAYSLLGLFSVNLPIIYGEGNRAFHRLQNEILGFYRDHTLFAWVVPAEGESEDDNGASGDLRGGRANQLLAPAPENFKGLHKVVPLSYGHTGPYEVTTRGISIRLLVIGQVGDDKIQAILHCGDEDDCTRAVALKLRKTGDDYYYIVGRRTALWDSYVALRQCSAQTVSILYHTRGMAARPKWLIRPQQHLSWVVCRLLDSRDYPPGLKFVNAAPAEHWRPDTSNFTVPGITGDESILTCEVVIEAYQSVRAKLMISLELSPSGDRACGRIDIEGAEPFTPYTQWIATIHESRWEVIGTRPTRYRKRGAGGFVFIADISRCLMLDRRATLVEVQVLRRSRAAASELFRPFCKVVNNNDRFSKLGALK